jgi:hypothetical protein
MYRDSRAVVGRCSLLRRGDAGRGQRRRGICAGLSRLRARLPWDDAFWGAAFRRFQSIFRSAILPAQTLYDRTTVHGVHSPVGAPPVRTVPYYRRDGGA